MKGKSVWWEGGFSKQFHEKNSLRNNGSIQPYLLCAWWAIRWRIAGQQPPYSLWLTSICNVYWCSAESVYFPMVLQKIAYLILTTAPLGYESRYYYFNFTHREVQAQGGEVNGSCGTGPGCTVGLGTQPPHSSQTYKKPPHNWLPFY